MKNTKSTKHALLTSIMALFLCVTMLLGTTFAWFTDTVTSGVNTIVAGNLDIEVQYSTNGTSWTDLEGTRSLFSDNLWEPGHTEIVYLKITNAGTLDLNYKVLVTPVSESGGVNVNGQSFKLSDYLVFGTTGPATTGTTYTRDEARAAVGTTTGLNVNNLTKTGTMVGKDMTGYADQYMALVVYMPEEVGNEANYKTGTAAPTIELGIKVVATQLTAENDSFGPDYDAGAVTDSFYTVGSYYDYFPQVSVSAPVAANNEDTVITATGKLNSSDTTETTLAKVTVPAAALADGVTSVDVTVKSADATNSNAQTTIQTEVEAGREVANFDVKVSGIKDGNTAVIPVEIFVGKGLSGVKVFHNGTEITGARYDASSGIVSFTTTSFSDYTVSYDPAAAAIGDKTYGTLELAVNAAQSGETVKLLKDCSVDSEVAINNNITIDLNGATVTNKKSASRPFQVSDCTVTIKNGAIVISEENTGAYGIIEIKALNADVNVTLDGVTLNGNTDDGALVRVHTVNPGKVGTLNMNQVNSTTNHRVQTTTSLEGEVRLNVIGGTYVADGRVFCADSYSETSTANFTNVTATSAFGPVIELDTVVGAFTNCNFSVTDLYSDSWWSVAIGLGYDAVANIDSGNYTSAKASAIEVYTTGGTFNISGGTFSGVNAVKTYTNDSGYSNINISGAVFTGALDVNYATTRTVITGGTFSSDPSNYISEDCIATQSGDKWIVTRDENIIVANPGNIQDYLDGKYGSIDGKTIVLSAGDYGKLELGRATKYAESNTEYYIGGISAENKKTYDEFVTIKNSGAWSASAYYVRNMSNVTLKAAYGATVTVDGLIASSGHVYGNVYDYVLDKAYTSGSAYYLTQKLANITIEGITFTAKAEFSTSSADTVIDGVTFKNCTFNIGNTASGNQALRYYNESDNGNVRNLTVDKCSFNNCFQGVYTQKINGVTVKNSSFDTTGHNAIAVQSGSGAVNHKAVVITGNTFANIGDRIIRFGDVGADTQITIQNNTATNSGDSSGQVIKAQSLAEGVTYNISGNNWGEGKTVANTELADR